MILVFTSYFKIPDCLETSDERSFGYMNSWWKILSFRIEVPIYLQTSNFKSRGSKQDLVGFYNNCHSCGGYTDDDRG